MSLKLYYVTGKKFRGIKLKFPQQLISRVYLFKWCWFSHVIQYYTSIGRTACEKFGLWRDKYGKIRGWSARRSGIGRGVCGCDGNTASYLHWVEADRAEAVYPPGEGANWAAPLFIPDVNLLTTRCKHTFLLVMVQSCEDRLRGTKQCDADNTQMECPLLVLPLLFYLTALYAYSRSCDNALLRKREVTNKQVLSDFCPNVWQTWGFWDAAQYLLLWWWDKCIHLNLGLFPFQLG